MTQQFNAVRWVASNNETEKGIIMGAETKKLPKVEGTYAWREIGSARYSDNLARVFTGSGGELMIEFFMSAEFGGENIIVKLKDCTKRWWFKLPDTNLGK